MRCDSFALPRSAQAGFSASPQSAILLLSSVRGLSRGPRLFTMPSPRYGFALLKFTKQEGDLLGGWKRREGAANPSSACLIIIY